MKKIGIVIVAFIASLGFNIVAVARAVQSPLSLHQSEQAVIVVAPNANSSMAQLQAFERSGVDKKWRALGDAIAVDVGKNGLAWGMAGHKKPRDLVIKQEGDNRTPAGIFSLGSAFGFQATAPVDLKLNYLSLTPTTVCVDDVHSKYYNEIVDSNKLTPDWKSGEQMRQIPEYAFGLVVNYNTAPKIKGHGSCVFMHIWKGPNQSTAGCVAMTQEYVEQMLEWVNPVKKPLLVILTQKDYNDFQSAWNLPPLGHQLKSLAPIKQALKTAAR